MHAFNSHPAPITKIYGYYVRTNGKRIKACEIDSKKTTLKIDEEIKKKKWRNWQKKLEKSVAYIGASSSSSQ